MEKSLLQIVEPDPDAQVVFTIRAGLRPFKIIADARDIQSLSVHKTFIDCIIRSVQQVLSGTSVSAVESAFLPFSWNEEELADAMKYSLPSNPQESDIILFSTALRLLEISNPTSAPKKQTIRDVIMGQTRRLMDIDREQDSCIDAAVRVDQITKHCYGIAGQVKRVGGRILHYYWQADQPDGNGAVIDFVYGHQGYGYIPDKADHLRRIKALNRWLTTL